MQQCYKTGYTHSLSLEKENVNIKFCRTKNISILKVTEIVSALILFFTTDLQVTLGLLLLQSRLEKQKTFSSVDT